MDAPAGLVALAEAAKVGKGQSARTTPRQIVEMYGWKRRGSWISEIIASHFEELGVQTVPDFESAYIDAPLYIIPANEAASTDAGGDEQAEPSGGSASGGSESESVNVPATPSHRISRLKAASMPPKRVSPDDTIERAITLMMRHDYSQLPVMTTDFEVKGMVSWRSIGRRITLNSSCKRVADCMDPHRDIQSTASIFDAIREVAIHDAVLVRDAKRVVGIVTAADLSEQFGVLAEPFLVLGDIETSLRRMIQSAFTKEDLVEVRDSTDASRTVETAADLTFGEYVRLLQKPESWSKLALGLDRVVFTEGLDRVRIIRNSIMHFDPDGIEQEQMDELRTFASFLEQICAVQPWPKL